MFIAGFPAGQLAANCYFVGAETGGECVIIDPGQDSAEGVDRLVEEHSLKPAAILVTHGHFDHAGSASELSRRFKAPIVSNFELASQLKHAQGPDPLGGNIGGTVKVKGISITMVPAVHSSSLGGQNEPPHYAGNPMGFVLQAAGEPTLIHAGDTGLTHEFHAVKDAFKPQIALLPIGGHFTMDAAQAAIAARYLGVKQVVPMHYGTFPLLTGTPAKLNQALGKSWVRVTTLTPGKPQKL